MKLELLRNIIVKILEKFELNNADFLGALKLINGN